MNVSLIPVVECHGEVLELVHLSVVVAGHLSDAFTIAAAGSKEIAHLRDFWGTPKPIANTGFSANVLSGRGIDATKKPRY